MNRRQKNKLSMYLVTEKVLSDNAVVWSGTPAFVDAENYLSAQIKKIQEAGAKHEEPSTGIAIDKRLIKIALSTEAATIGGGVLAYAVHTGNAELKEAVKFTQRKLFKCRDHRMLSHCSNIHDRAMENLAALAAYGINISKLNALHSLIVAFMNKVPVTTAARATRQSLTKTIKSEFADTDNLLNFKMDTMMLAFKMTHREFYVAYKFARKIVELGVRHTRFQIVVKDAEGNLLSNARVSLFQNTLDAYTATTDESGKLKINLVKPGIYNLIVQKDGYTTWQKEVNFISGKRLARTAVLTPILSY